MKRRMAMDEYITEKIGNEYEKWEKGDIVFMKAATGAGKTHFILHTLLGYAARRRQYILYLVNRRILKMQLEAEISELPFDQQGYIKVELYQTLEARIREGANIWNESGYTYIICDEAHYFSSDALFNTGTELGYLWIRLQGDNSVRVYISATLNLLVEARIKEDEEKKKYLCSRIYNFPSRVINVYQIKAHNQWTYSGEVDYSYLECHIIDDISEVAEEVSKSKEKWLIFVDSIDRGKNLYKEVSRYLENPEKGKSSEVLFLSADYKEKSDEVFEVKNIAKEKKQCTRILICTSVMDNGISLNDFELRNLVVEADTQDEFIQMIGRKRNVGEKTKLYLVNKSAMEIERRLHKICELKKLCVEYLTYFNPIKDKFASTRDYDSLEELNKEEQNAVWHQHSWALKKLVQERNSAVQQIFYTVNGWLCLNFFSKERIEYLERFYRNLQMELKEDDFALVKKQLSWLGKSSEEAELFIEQEKKTQYEKSWEKVNSCFESIVGKNMDEKEFINMKMFLKDDLKDMVEQKKDIDGASIILSNLLKKDRVLSKKNIEWLRIHCGLNYKEEQEDKEGSKVYRLEKVKK